MTVFFIPCLAEEGQLILRLVNESQTKLEALKTSLDDLVRKIEK